jgi:hypothetical protein
MVRFWHYGLATLAAAHGVVAQSSEEPQQPPAPSSTDQVPSQLSPEPTASTIEAPTELATTQTASQSTTEIATESISVVTAEPTAAASNLTVPSELGLYGQSPPVYPARKSRMHPDVHEPKTDSSGQPMERAWEVGAMPTLGQKPWLPR